MEKRWTWLMAATGLWTLTGVFVYQTCHSKDLGIAMCAAILGQIACLIVGLVVFEAILKHVLAGHRAAMSKVVEEERVRVETIAQAAVDLALADVHELRR